MPFQIIKNRYTTNDHKSDLNFENDLLYEDIYDNDYKKNTIARSIFEDHEDEIVTTSKNIKKNHHIKNDNKNVKNDNSTYNIYILFICVSIILIIIWYIFKNKPKDDLNIIETYPTLPELTMMSPDFGTGTRYGL